MKTVTIPVVKGDERPLIQLRIDDANKGTPIADLADSRVSAGMLFREFGSEAVLADIPVEKVGDGADGILRLGFDKNRFMGQQLVQALDVGPYDTQSIAYFPDVVPDVAAGILKISCLFKMRPDARPRWYHDLVSQWEMWGERSWSLAVSGNHKYYDNTSGRNYHILNTTPKDSGKLASYDDVKPQVGTQDLEIRCRFMIPAYNTGGHSDLVSQWKMGAAGGGTQCWTLCVRKSGAQQGMLDFAIGTNIQPPTNAHRLVTAPGFILENQWYDVRILKSGSAVSCWVNGQAVTLSPDPGATLVMPDTVVGDGTVPVTIGGVWKDAEGFVPATWAGSSVIRSVFLKVGGETLISNDWVSTTGVTMQGDAAVEVVYPPGHLVLSLVDEGEETSATSGRFISRDPVIEYGRFYDVQVEKIGTRAVFIVNGHMVPVVLFPGSVIPETLKTCTAPVSLGNVFEDLADEIPSTHSADAEIVSAVVEVDGIPVASVTDWSEFDGTVRNAFIRRYYPESWLDGLTPGHVYEGQVYLDFDGQRQTVQTRLRFLLKEAF